MSAVKKLISPTNMTWKTESENRVSYSGPNVSSGYIALENESSEIECEKVLWLPWGKQYPCYLKVDSSNFEAASLA